MQTLWSAVQAAFGCGQTVTLVTVTQGKHTGASGLYDQAGTLLAGTSLGPTQDSGLVRTADSTLYVETLWPKPCLVIFGGGHVAVPVAALGKLTGFAVVVNDDRQEFANSRRFPQADKILAMGHEQAFKLLQIDNRHYVVIVTRGHVQDRRCLELALNSKAAYIGVIGSKKKAAETKQWLLALGYGQSDLDRIHSPIGLEIGAVTPEEIAISIMAEIIKVKSRRPVPANLEEIAAAIAAKSDAETWALITIVASTGSVPRGAGARMLVRATGENIGTVGGGPGEKEAQELALEVIRDGTPRLREFHLNNSAAANAGMVCGGNLTMFIQPV